MTAESAKGCKRNLLQRYPLVSFFVLSYLLFLIAILIIGAIVSLTPLPDIWMGLLIAVAAWTPNAAAVIVIGVTEGKAQIKDLFAGCLQWRIRPWWVLIGLAPIPIAFVSAGLYAIFAGVVIPEGTAGLAPSTLVLMAFFHIIQGATGEELGWRGFALPRLQRRFSPLVSAIILGLVVSGWHGLLHLVSPTGVPEWQFWLLMASYSVIVAWAYNGTQGNLLIAMLFHFAFNFSLELVSAGLGLVPLESLFAIRTAIYAALVVALVIVTGKNLSKGKASSESR
jgi:CAAX protease family protein